MVSFVIIHYISQCNSSRNKVHNKCNTLESSLNHPPSPRPWKNASGLLTTNLPFLLTTLQGTPLGSFYFRRGKVRLSKGWPPLLPYPWVRNPEAILRGLLQGCWGKATAPLTSGLTNQKPTKEKDPFWEPPLSFRMESPRPTAGPRLRIPTPSHAPEALWEM